MVHGLLLASTRFLLARAMAGVEEDASQEAEAKV